MKVLILHQYVDRSHYAAFNDEEIIITVMDPFNNGIRSCLNKMALKDYFSQLRTYINLFRRKFYHFDAIIFACAPSYPLLILNFLVFKCRFPANEFIFHSSYTPEDKITFIRKVFIQLNLKFLRKYVSRCACVSERSKKFYDAYFQKVKVVSHCLADTEVFEKPSVKNDKIVFIGRDARYKNLSRLLELCDLAAVEIDVVGSCKTETITSYSNSKYISFLGKRDRHWILENLGEYKALVMLSDYREPFGLVYLEAATSGVPIITTKNLGFEEICEGIDYPHSLILQKDVSSLEFANTVKYVKELDNENEIYFILSSISQKFSKYNIRRTWNDLIEN